MKKPPIKSTYLGACIAMVLLPVIEDMHNKLISNILTTLGVALFVGAVAYVIKKRIKAKTHNGGQS